jgi:hypothetical protein
MTLVGVCLEAGDGVSALVTSAADRIAVDSVADEMLPGSRMKCCAHRTRRGVGLRVFDRDTAAPVTLVKPAPLVNRPASFFVTIIGRTFASLDAVRPVMDRPEPDVAP